MAFLIDSNITIYSYSPEYEYLRDLIINDACVISEISRVEVLGYHGLKPDEEKYFKNIFEYIPVLLPDADIFNTAIEIRKKYKLKLADSIIAATAKIHNLDIYTRNLNDFKSIKGIVSINPVR